MTALPPNKPTHNFFPLRFSLPLTISDADRRAMVETAAYYIAERRGFAPGHDAEDWAAAEAEVEELLAQARRHTDLTGG